MSADGSTATDEVSERSSKVGRVEHLTVEERVAKGKAARAEAPRSAHAAWEPSSDRVGPVELLEEQAKTRVPELVPIRYGRMLVSPFTFYRGAALVMAADLAESARTGLQTQLCGDAHLSNFGAFAAPDRRLVFSVNDFDETLPGPFEWDVKRLAASFAVAGRDRGFDDKQREVVNLAVGKGYREAMSGYAAMPNLDLWYTRVGVDDIMAEVQSVATMKERKRAEQNVAKTRTKTSLKAFAKLTEIVDGEPHIIGDPPTVTPIEDLFSADRAHEFDAFLHGVFRSYRRTLPGDRHKLLETYRYVHAARKVVGVGSVGTRAYIVLLLGRDDNDPLFLQFKEARGVGARARSSARASSQITASASSKASASPRRRATSCSASSRSGHRRRQTRLLHPPALGREGQRACRADGTDDHDLLREGVRLRAGARSCPRRRRRSRSRAISVPSDTFDRALALFAESYADQNERDYNTFSKAVKDGTITAETGV